MKVDVLPLAFPAMPHAGFLRLAGPRPTLAVHKLGQADVGDAGGLVADQVDVGVQDGGVDGLAVFGQNWRKVAGEERDDNNDRTTITLLVLQYN